jgi:hypothetical protein
VVTRMRSAPTENTLNPAPAVPWVSTNDTGPANSADYDHT